MRTKFRHADRAITTALKELRSSGVSKKVYLEAERAIGSDNQGYFVRDSGLTGVVNLITLCGRIERGEL